MLPGLASSPSACPLGFLGAFLAKSSCQPCSLTTWSTLDMSEQRFSSASAPFRTSLTRAAAVLKMATMSQYRLTRKSQTLVNGLIFVKSQISLLMSSLDMSAVTAASKRAESDSRSWARRDLGNEEMNVALDVILHLILKLYFCRRFCSQESVVDSDDELELELSSGCCGGWDCVWACGWVIMTCGWYTWGPDTSIGFMCGSMWCPMLCMSSCAGVGCRHSAVEEDATPEPLAAALLLERDLLCLRFFLEWLPISVTAAHRKLQKCRQLLGTMPRDAAATTCNADLLPRPLGTRPRLTSWDSAQTGLRNYPFGKDPLHPTQCLRASQEQKLHSSPGTVAKNDLAIH